MSRHPSWERDGNSLLRVRICDDADSNPVHMPRAILYSSSPCASRAFFRQWEARSSHSAAHRSITESASTVTAWEVGSAIGRLLQGADGLGDYLRSNSFATFLSKYLRSRLIAGESQCLFALVLAPHHRTVGRSNLRALFQRLAPGGSVDGLKLREDVSDHMAVRHLEWLGAA